ncbi:MAG: NAD-dependent epimerase/dehydratase family protein [candidate division KSB1 bacterium]|nr:NAD-dependent epimerase/dehydratase family protein [candidate division KSB1 bacterium]
MNILVTGGAGFIGSHIADAYIQAGHQVTIIDNLSTGRRENINPDADFIELDIQNSELEKIFSEKKFDIVNHQAAQMNVRLSVKNPVYDAKVNIIGFLNLLENCVNNNVRKVIFASSGGVIYGEQEYFPADEEHRLQPCSPYGVAKLAGEKYLYYYHLTHDLNYTALRYANVYGPRQNPHGEAGVVAIFLERMLDGREAVINGDGKQTRDFVFIRDIVDANIKALDKGDNEAYNIGTGQETDINTIFHTLNKLAEADLTEKHADPMPGEQRKSVLAVIKAENELGWKARYDLEAGLSETIQAYKRS